MRAIAESEQVVPLASCVVTKMPTHRFAAITLKPVMKKHDVDFNRGRIELSFSTKSIDSLMGSLDL
jgi:hypothetical protein